MKKIIFFIATLLITASLVAIPIPNLKLMPYSGLNLSIAGQNVDNYMEQGGARWVIGGSLDVISGGDLDIESGATFKLAGTDMTTQLGYLSGVTAGTALASKALVLGTSKEIATITTATITNVNVGASGSVGSLKIYPATATNGLLTFTVQNQGAARTQTIDIDAMGQASIFNLGDPGAAAVYFAISTNQLTLAEMDRLDGITAGTALASKALIVDASIDIAGLNVISAASLNLTALASIDFDDTTDGIVDVLDLSHTSSDDNATALDGIGISFELENATGTSTVEEWASLDVLSTTITDGSEDGDIVLNTMLGGTISPALTIDASDQSVTLGANSTDADGIHQLRIFPVTASMGSMLINAVANAADHLITIQNVSHGQATVYSLQDAANATADIVTLSAGVTTPGTLVRADLTEEALAIYGIPIYSLRAADLAAMGVSETAGDHYLLLTTDEQTLVSEISNNESETSISWFQFIIPPEYVAAGDVKVRIKHSLFGAGTDGAGGSTVDIAVFEQDGNGATGSDLSTTTAATTITKGSWATTDFVITAAGLVAGDILSVKLTTVVTENATANLQAELDGLALLLDIKG